MEIISDDELAVDKVITDKGGQVERSLGAPRLGLPQSELSGVSRVWRSATGADGPDCRGKRE